VVRKKTSSDQVNRQRIFSVYLDRKRGDYLTTRFKEEAIRNVSCQEQVIEELMKEVFKAWMGIKI
jgi:hypothetical protein